MNGDDFFGKLDDLLYAPVKAVCNYIEEPLTALHAKRDRENEQHTANIQMQMREHEEKLKREKMLFISNSIATVGNTVKLVAPPNCGNPAAINAAQWFAMIQSSVSMLRAATRDRTPETIIETRNAINSTWKALLEP